MLIKIIDKAGYSLYVSGDDITEVTEVDRCDGKCWLVGRKEPNGGHLLPIDKNEPFGEWLKYQIGGEYWQKQVDRWAEIELQMDLVSDRGEEAMTRTG